MAGILSLSLHHAEPSQKETAMAITSTGRVHEAAFFMAQCGLGGSVTVRVTIGPLLVELVLLETTPLESTPVIVNV
jgi:hypothetical protein